MKWIITILLIAYSALATWGWLSQKREAKAYLDQLDIVNRHMIERHQSEDSLNRVIDSLQSLYGFEND